MSGREINFHGDYINKNPLPQKICIAFAALFFYFH